mgnify:CR=1 FL=1
MIFSPTPSQVLLFGASGQIGSAIFRALPKNLVRSISWDEIASLSLSHQIQLIDRTLKSDSHSSVQILFANGITNPSLEKKEILYSNYEFPRSIIRALIERPNFRFLTLGTVMEFFPEACAANTYLGSKFKLGQEALEFSTRWPGQWLHLRLHTIYTLPLKPYMFLGQLTEALKKGQPFAMSSGKQLREYHHADDVANSVVALLNKNWKSLRATLELSSGRPITLAELATAVFHYFGKSNLLQIGKIQGQQGDNTQMAFPRSEPWLIGDDREPISGVIRMLTNSL